MDEVLPGFVEIPGFQVSLRVLLLLLLSISGFTRFGRLLQENAEFLETLSNGFEIY